MQQTSKADVLRIITFIVLLLLLLYLWIYIFIPKLIPNPLFIGTPSKKINILIMGLDYSYDNKHNLSKSHRTDSLMLASIDPISNKLNALSIPRDSLVEIPGYGLNKINSAYAIGKAYLTKHTVSKYLGIHIDKYLIIDPRGIEALVDALGGVNIYVDHDMYYNDNWGNLHINLKKGLHKLNGSQAHGFIRFRHDALGDISRIRRQQYFLSVLFKKLGSPSALLRSPLILTSLKRAFKSDLSFKDIILIGNFARLLKPKDFTFKTLPGNFSSQESLGSYWIPDEGQVKETLRDMGIW